MTRPETVEALAEVLGEMRAVAWDFFPDPAQAIDDVASAVLAAIDSGQVPGVGRLAPQQVDPEAVRERAYIEGYEAGLLAPQSEWMRAHAVELAKAWDEGRRAGADMGLGISERIVGSRDDWPTVPANPYRSAVVSAAEPGGEVGTGAGEGATGQDTGTAWVTRSADCPEAPAQAHLPAAHDAALAAALVTETSNEGDE